MDDIMIFPTSDTTPKVPDGQPTTVEPVIPNVLYSLD